MVRGGLLYAQVLRRKHTRNRTNQMARRISPQHGRDIRRARDMRDRTRERQIRTIERIIKEATKIIPRLGTRAGNRNRGKNRCKQWDDCAKRYV